MAPLGAGAGLPTGTATFLFTDIEGSTRLVQEVGLAQWQELLATHHQVLREAFTAVGGVEVNTEGDAFFVAFAQARDAILATATGQRALMAQAWPEGAVIRVRMGVHTGEAALVGNDYVGLDIHRAARIASSAHGGQVVVSDTTRALVESALPDGMTLVDLGEHRLKDLARAERIWQLHAEGLEREFPPLKTLDRTPNNLPIQLTSFVGRDADLAEGLRLLGQSRLLTLTGPGGTGKTRLSLQIAAEVSDEFKDGVYFVPLAPITDPELVASTVLQVIGVSDASGRAPEATLLEHVASREMLLVLDNLEQVLGVAPFVAEILKAGPATKIVTSSRAALRVYGEQEFPIPPLPVPTTNGATTIDDLSEFASVQLFVERAMAVKPDFRVTAENAAAVAGIAALVDGLPLALELAAARIRLLAPQAMLTRLQGRLGELGGGARDLPERQQTLRGAIAWSYDLLDPGVQALFARFAIFVRGASLEQVEAVCGPADELGVDLLDGLTTLVEHNLVRSLDEGPEPRFFMLHVIRESALERLAERSDAASVAERHAQVYADLVERAGPNLTGADQKRWLDQLELDHDNLRAALTWAMDHDQGELAARILTPMWRFWQIRGYLHEGRQRTEALLDLPSLQGSSRTRSDVLEAAGGIAYWQGDQEGAETYYQEALAIERKGDDRARLANALYNASFPGMIKRTDPNPIRALVDEAAQIYRELGDEAGLARALWGIGNLAYYYEPPDWELAVSSLKEAARRFESLGDQFGLAWALYTLGLAEIGLHELDASARSLGRALEIFAAADDRAGVPLLLNGYALIAVEEGDADRAARLEGARLAMEERTGAGLLESRTYFLPEIQEALAGVIESMPDLVAAGRKLSAEDAIAYAYERLNGPTSPPTASS